MIIEITEVKEFYKNGQLSYVENIARLSTAHAHLYDNRRVDKNGVQWIRVDGNVKFNEDGTVRWRIDYDRKGNVMPRTSSTAQIDLFI